MEEEEEGHVPVAFEAVSVAGHDVLNGLQRVHNLPVNVLKHLVRCLQDKNGGLYYRRGNKTCKNH